MSDNILRFEPVEVGAVFRFDSDTVLEEAKGNEFKLLAVLGQLEDGSVYIAGNANAGETLVMMEIAKQHLVFGSD